MSIPGQVLGLNPPYPIDELYPQQPSPIRVLKSRTPSAIRQYSSYNSSDISLYISGMIKSCYGRFMAPTTYKRAEPSDIIDDMDYNSTSTSYNSTSTSYNATSSSYNDTSIFNNTSRLPVSSPRLMPVLDLGRPAKRKASVVGV